MRFKYLIIFLFFLIPGFIFQSFAQPSKIITGIITDSKSGEALPGCNIEVLNSHIGTTSDADGVFALVLPAGNYQLKFSYLGFREFTQSIALLENDANPKLIIKLNPGAVSGETVDVYADQETDEISSNQIKSKDLQKMPSIYKDTFRAVKILPGVSSNNELSSGYNVRGGNFDENLVYLNGYEIYRPFLIKGGQEENLSLINPDMVDDLTFYNGNFPVNFGDKMSSVLNVAYQSEFTNKISGRLSSNMFNSGIVLAQKFHGINWIAGARYANPTLFLGQLQTSGDYRPAFMDVQFSANRQVGKNGRAEILFVRNQNKYELVPENWQGHYKMDPFGLDVRGVEINYLGDKDYSFKTWLAGAKYVHKIGLKSDIRVSVSQFGSREDEDVNLDGSVYYIPDAREPQLNRTFLKSTTETVDNLLELTSRKVDAQLNLSAGNHLISAGFTGKFSDIDEQTDESYSERTETAGTPATTKIHQRSFSADNISLFLMDDWQLFKWAKLNLGSRYTKIDFSGEYFFSPRAMLSLYAGARDILQLGYGNYYQPPFYYEFKNYQNSPELLKSQQSRHYTLSWNRQLKEKLSFQFSLFYKHFENLNTYTLDQMKLDYLEFNKAEGYAQGFDVLIKGEIVPEMNSWVSYSYLDSKERLPGQSYRRRLLDQHHTIRIFMQDKIPQNEHLQAHTRVLFGSGYLYNPQKMVIDESSGQKFLVARWERQDEFSAYFRVDMGLSYKWHLFKKYEAIIQFEVLNVFNHTNIASYTWFEVAPQRVERIPHVFTPRFFNIGLDVRL